MAAVGEAVVSYRGVEQTGFKTQVGDKTRRHPGVCACQLKIVDSAQSKAAVAEERGVSRD